MPTATPTGASELLDALHEHFARNLIGGRWHFPAAPYEFEIRSPADSRVIAVVPLSSRFDVAAAVSAGRVVVVGPWSDAHVRAGHPRGLLTHLDSRAVEIALLQSSETGLDVADSLLTVQVTLRQLNGLLSAAPPTGRGSGVVGHILSWGLPFTDALTSIWPSLVRGNAVVLKPSLRAPLSAAYLGLLAGEAGLPPGVVNVVQGTGVDVGAELIRRRDLVGLHVRGNERTMAAAGRARTGVPLHLVRAGGNACVVGPGLDDAGRLADHLSALVRMNSAGGVFGMPLLAVHPDAAARLLPAVVERLASMVAAPLAGDTLRARCLSDIAMLTGSGATVRLGGCTVPDDVDHRMGWRVPPTVLELGGPSSAAAWAWVDRVPLGPVLGVLTVSSPWELRDALRCRGSADGFAWMTGFGTDLRGVLPHAAVVSDPLPGRLADALVLPPSWTAGPR